MRLGSRERISSRGPRPEKDMARRGSAAGNHWAQDPVARSVTCHHHDPVIRLVPGVGETRGTHVPDTWLQNTVCWNRSSMTRCKITSRNQFYGTLRVHHPRRPFVIVPFVLSLPSSHQASLLIGFRHRGLTFNCYLTRMNKQDQRSTTRTNNQQQQ